MQKWINQKDGNSNHEKLYAEAWRVQVLHFSKDDETGTIDTFIFSSNAIILYLDMICYRNILILILILIRRNVFCFR